MKTIKLFLLAFPIACISFSIHAENVFSKGDRKMDLTIGVGTVAYGDKDRATFDQHFGMEWGIAEFADKFSLGLGFAINNTYGGTFESLVTGAYDYTYKARTYGKKYSFSQKKWERVDETRTIKRSGVGTADVDISREDVNAQAVVAFHYSPIKRLDVYAKCGVGIGVMNYLISNKRNLQGFGEDNHRSEHSSKYLETVTEYSYNDLSHTDWQGFKAKLVPAMSVYIGATYMLTDRIGADMQLGIISANLKGVQKGYPNSYSVLALGASYRF